MKVFLIEGVGGDIISYENALKNIGIIGRPEVEVIKYTVNSEEDQKAIIDQLILQINANVESNYM